MTATAPTRPTTTTPTLPVAKAKYLRGGISRVLGWLNPSTATYLSSLEVLQRVLGIAGDVCEIGVYHGKSFLCLALGLPLQERAVAIDVFEDQQLNVDRSGRGDREVFEAALAEHGAGNNVVILKGDSRQLENNGFVAEGRRFRLFSIDGGHTAEITRNDLLVAERTVVDRGAVVLDDYLNQHWLGVITGLFRYWELGGTLVPTAALPGKLLLTPSAEQATAYRELLGSHFGAAWTKRAVRLADQPLDVFGEFPWIVLDDAGKTGLLAGAAAASKAASAPPTRAVPVEYLEHLERRVEECEGRGSASTGAPIWPAVQTWSAARFGSAGRIRSAARPLARRAARVARGIRG